MNRSRVRAVAALAAVLVVLPIGARAADDLTSYFNGGLRSSAEVVAMLKAVLAKCGETAPAWRTADMHPRLADMADEVIAEWPNDPGNQKIVERRISRGCEWAIPRAKKGYEGQVGKLRKLMARYQAAEAAATDDVFAKEAAEERQNCRSTSSHYLYDCECLARKYVAFSRAYAGDSSQNIMQRRQAVRGRALAACLTPRDRWEVWEFKNCFPGQSNRRTDAEAYCGCVARRVAAAFHAEPPNPADNVNYHSAVDRQLRTLRRNALAACDEPDPGTTRPAGVPTDAQIKDFVLALPMDGLTLSMTPDGVRQAARKAGYEEVSFQEDSAHFQKNDWNAEIRAWFEDGVVARLKLEGGRFSEAEWKDFEAVLLERFAKLTGGHPLDYCVHKEGAALQCHAEYHIRDGDDVARQQRGLAQVDMLRDERKGRVRITLEQK